MRYARLFLTIAAISYTLPFYAPTTWYWLIMLWPVFLFYAMQKNSLTLIDYLLWALVISIMHLAPLGNAVIRMDVAPPHRIIPFMLLIIGYVALYPFAFLLVSQMMFKAFSKYEALQILGWSVCCWLYILAIEYALFWLFGRCEGYLFMNPLLPFTAVPRSLALLHLIGMSGALLLYSLSSGAFIWATQHRTLTHAIPLILCSILWLVPAYYENSHFKPPAWASTIATLPLLIPKTSSVDQASRLIAYEATCMLGKRPGLQMLIMPESAWNGLALNTTTELPAFQNLLLDNILIGSFSLDETGYHNSLYWFHKSMRAARFDKTHAVPFVERTPWQGTTMNSKIWIPCNPIVPSSKSHDPIQFKSITLTPCICSELFCNTRPPNNEKASILAICNDWWFGYAYFRRLMLMGAQLRAIEWNRPIFYASFYYAQYIDQYGLIQP